VFLDCPPSLGLLTVNALAAADTVLIPLQCEYFALEGISELVNTMRRVQRALNPRLDIEGVLLTMVDERTNLTQQVMGEIREHFKDKVFRTTIPRSVRLGEARASASRSCSTTSSPGAPRPTWTSPRK
jgi:chromosome partitioning protein